MRIKRITDRNDMEHIFHFDQQNNENADSEEKVLIKKSTINRNQFARRIPRHVCI